MYIRKCARGFSLLSAFINTRTNFILEIILYKKLEFKDIEETQQKQAK